MRLPAQREQATLWRIPELGQLEVLHATFLVHVFPRHTHETFAIGLTTHGAKLFSCEGRTYYVAAVGIIVTNPAMFMPGTRLATKAAPTSTPTPTPHCSSRSRASWLAAPSRRRSSRSR